MKKFVLEMCDECSVWTPSVKCKKTEKTLILHISRCEKDDKYQYDSTALEEGCVTQDETILKSKKEMEDFLNYNFELIDNGDCIPYYQKNEVCPECNDSLEPGLED